MRESGAIDVDAWIYQLLRRVNVYVLRSTSRLSTGVRGISKSQQAHNKRVDPISL